MRRFAPRPSRFAFVRLWATVAAIASLVVAITASGALRPVEDALASQRFGLIQRPASQGMVLVEIDAASLNAAEVWPWGRDRYAQALDHLDAAGARLVGFDVDFSAKSTPEMDHRFASVIAQTPGAVILPTFVQPARRSTPDASMVENTPLAALSEEALLASVNVVADSDGRVRRYLRGFSAGDAFRPSMAALMAGEPFGRTAPFHIDYGIQPASIPTLSFQDVYENGFDPALVRGRAVLIGATALELGDNLATPRHGILPGVVVHALAYESLVQGRALYFPHPLVTLILIVTVALTLRPARQATALAGLARRHLLVLSFVLGAPFAFQAMAPVILPVTPLLLTQVFCLAVAIQQELKRRGEDIVRAREAGLLHLAMHEPETELPNRRALLEEISRTRRGGNGAVAVVAIGVDRYAQMRAAIGYGMANDVVRAVAARLLRTCHASRLGYISTGVLGLVVGRGEASALEAELARLESLDPAYEVDGALVDAFLRLGVAYDWNPAETDERLLEQATIALDEARRQNRRRLMFQPAAFQDPSLNISLMSDLRQGLEEGQIALHYQPKRAANGAIVGVEALMRWTHPTRGLIQPDIFIVAAEETGSIRELTEWTLIQALADSAALRRAGHQLTVSINVSGRVLGDRAFRDFVLHAVGGQAQQLCLEVTETAVIESPQAAIEAVGAFRRAGLAISIDDYGVGLSSLSYLKLLEADELKLDRSIAMAVDTERDRLILRSTIELAHSLNMKVVAEGIEDAAVESILLGLGCDLIQGYLVARPMPLAELRTYLDAAAPNPVLAAAS
ncbi:EAL domain-containing protein [Phenylobacterium sp.]|uniref:EAL domain-containing protein n=1 Tax=Phenylobacterium sp. TaxID=1871053 RepID=UPI002730E318|nr:EAL domain-containing protein [Phenylobacterium sp.]MDP2214709.1 EAL domain-containing protein [Phenylobacterium sp.]